MVIVYDIPGPLGTATDDFFLLINDMSTQHRILIVGNFNLDQMPKLILQFKILTRLSVYNIQLRYTEDYWILHLIIIIIIIIICLT